MATSTIHAEGPSVSERLLQLRYRWSAQQVVAELLAKKWMEPAIPFAAMILVIAALGLYLPNYFTLANVAATSREFAEFGLVAIAMAIVVIVGGIDLSVGATFALANFVSLYLFNIRHTEVLVIIPIVLLVGGAIGACNGIMIGFVKTRAFLTTLVTLLILRAVLRLLDRAYAVELTSDTGNSAVWDFIGSGAVFGVPFNVIILAIVAIVGHLVLSRSRPGWHLYAIGGGRRAARNAGINVEWTLFFAYVTCGILSALAGILFAARLNYSSSETGSGLEIQVLTAVVLGGVSLGGGKGSIGRALIGSTIVLVLVNGLARLGLASGYSQIAVGAILLLAVGFDVKWLKNKEKAISKIYVVPTYKRLPRAPSTLAGSGTPYEENSRLSDAIAIGEGEVDSPEDVILDRQGRLYCGTREGWILRFERGATSKPEVFGVTGGIPLGMAFDKGDNLIFCCGGMGLYCATPAGEVFCLTDQTNRTPWRIKDDSRIVLSDDLDIAPDGKIYFSDATTRYDIEEWALDSLESRGNGRMICYDPATKKTKTIINNLCFPNGVTVAHDGQSVLFVETYDCSLSRYWIEGPRKGTWEKVIPNLPGYPDNINRASDGNYWMSIVGIRTAAFDLALRKPGFRTRMVKRLPPDEWLFPNINNGCVVKFNDRGEVLESYWDLGGRKHPTITSMREHEGYLYLGGLTNNKVGRVKLDGADPTWIGPESYWGKRR
jgi:ribose transport system permease protein